MTWDVGLVGINNVCEVPSRQEFLDELPAKLALHERTGRNLANEAGWLL